MSVAFRSQLEEVAEVLHQREMVARELALRSESVDVEARSFEAIVATETPALVFDFRSYEVIEEVLVARGGRFPDSVPLLDDHSRYGALSVIGSAREFRQTGSQWVGRGFVAKSAGAGDEKVEAIWTRVRDGHIRAVSIGYQVLNYVDIPAGRSQRINGKEYKAGDRMLRVSTEWQVRELSLTPIGADEQALIRSMKGIPAQKPRRFFR